MVAGTTPARAGDSWHGVLGRGARVALRAERFILHDPSLLAAEVMLGVLIFLALFGQVIWPKSTTAVDLNVALAPPSAAHPMGTDSLGRDVFARFNEGARISLTIGAIVVVTGALFGSAIGVLAGTFSRATDNVLMRGMDSLLAFPPLILAMAVTVGIGVGLATATLGVTLTT